jgi:hypothetical protein
VMMLAAGGTHIEDGSSPEELLLPHLPHARVVACAAQQPPTATLRGVVSHTPLSQMPARG